MAKLTFTQFDSFEWDSITCTKEIPEADKNIILSLTEEGLKNIAKNYIVGKTNTKSGDSRYYADTINIGGFIFSIQVNYAVWKQRHQNGTPNDAPITEEEFNRVTLFDVEIKHGDTVILEPCQKTIAGIINFLKKGLK